jgi:ribosome-binding protein aMBF1 (putative translation factor)
MSVADVSRIESGRLRPYESQVEKLATALGVTREELLQDDEPRGAAEPAPAA